MNMGDLGYITLTRKRGIAFRTIVYVTQFAVVSILVFGIIRMTWSQPSFPEALVQVDPNRPLTFAVLGDSRHHTDVYMRLLDRTVEDENAFLINLGDLVERGTRRNFATFQNLMADYPLPFYPIPGNHDALVHGLFLRNYLAFSGAPALHYCARRRRVRCDVR